MMAPKYERAQLLSLAIERAAERLDEPISAVEVTADKVVCRAGPACVTMSYGYADAHDGQGAAILGAGSWWVSVDEAPAPEDEGSRHERVAWALGRVAGRWLRKQG